MDPLPCHPNHANRYGKEEMNHAATTCDGVGYGDYALKRADDVEEHEAVS